VYFAKDSKQRARGLWGLLDLISSQGNISASVTYLYAKDSFMFRLAFESLLTGEQLWQKTGGGDWQETASMLNWEAFLV